MTRAESNRRNATRSTKPKTTAGVERLQARRHGQAVLPPVAVEVNISGASD